MPSTPRRFYRPLTAALTAAALLAALLTASPALAARDRDALHEAIRAQRAPLLACYDKALETQPGLSGKLTTAFTVAEDGTVSDARIAASTLGAPALEACVRGAVAAWRFAPAPGAGPTNVHYPFTFSPGPAE
jgi:TonB family protein